MMVTSCAWMSGVEKPAVPKLALGAAANAASDAWVIKAHTESSAAAASEVEARHAIVNIGNTLPAQARGPWAHSPTISWSA